MINNTLIAMMAAQAAFGILGPIILFLVLKHRYGMKTEAFVIGCVTMLVFAMVLISAAAGAQHCPRSSDKAAADPSGAYS